MKTTEKFGVCIFKFEMNWICSKFLNNGLLFIDLFDNEQKIYPRLYAYVYDHEESCLVWYWWWNNERDIEKF